MRGECWQPRQRGRHFNATIDDALGVAGDESAGHADASRRASVREVSSSMERDDRPTSRRDCRVRAVDIDARHGRASVAGGALWRGFDAVAGAFGLATTGGLISSTGVGGAYA